MPDESELEAIERGLSALLDGPLSVGDRRTIAGARFGVEAVHLAVKAALEESQVRYTIAAE